MHIGVDVVEQYVMGALDVESSRFVEGHVMQCPACAALLQREAALEVGLHEVAGLKKVVFLTTRRRRITALVASAAVALAAGLVLVVAVDRVPAPESRPGLRQCTDASTARACISRAQFDGVITIGPDLEPIVPRYDLVSPEGAVP
jgi:hypothetical protein